MRLVTGEPNGHERGNAGDVYRVNHMASFSTLLMIALEISDNVKWDGDAHE